LFVFGVNELLTCHSEPKDPSDAFSVFSQCNLLKEQIEIWSAKVREIIYEAKRIWRDFTRAKLIDCGEGKCGLELKSYICSLQRIDNETVSNMEHNIHVGFNASL
jgi:hypothetical protein